MLEMVVGPDTPLRLGLSLIELPHIDYFIALELVDKIKVMFAILKINSSTGITFSIDWPRVYKPTLSTVTVHSQALGSRAAILLKWKGISQTCQAERKSTKEDQKIYIIKHVRY